jgi:hypothetical protein
VHQTITAQLRRTEIFMSLQHRLQVAEHAARLLLAGEARDLASAKRKALRHWPELRPEYHPDASDIEQAMAARKRLFVQPVHMASLERKRRAALHAMQLLESFEPRLSGPVYSGTALDASPVELHLFADCSEDVSMFLSDQRIPHDLRDLQLQLRDGRRLRVPVYLFEAGEDAFELIVFPFDEMRRPAPLEPGEARPMIRADVKAVRRLLQDTGQSDPS